SEFFQGGKLSADQIEFLDLVIDHLTARGVMDPKLLYETPYTDFDSKGVDGVFNHADAVQLVSILRDVESRTAAYLPPTKNLIRITCTSVFRLRRSAGRPSH